jgi:hypothetical protein
MLHGRERKYVKGVGRKPYKHFILKNKVQMQDNIKMNVKDIGSILTEYIWLRLGTSGGL